MSSELKPKIRFKGFTDDWEQRKFEQFALYRNGKAHENDISDNGKYVVVNSKFCSTNGSIRKYSDKQNEPLLKNEIAFVLSDVPNGRALARTFLVDKSNKYTLNQRIAGITPLENTDPYYLFVLMNRNKYFLQFDDGAKQTNLSVSDIYKFSEMFPNKTEQENIGSVFNNLDNLITLHQRQCDKLVELKKSLLEKMFPKNNSVIPEIRFKGFTDDWEQRKFTEFVEFFKGQTYSPNDVRENGTLVLRSSNVQNGEVTRDDNVYISNKVVNVSNVKIGDVIVVVRNGSRALIGKHAKIKEKMPNTVIGAFMTGIRSKNSEFINSLLNTSIFEQEIEKNMGATINQITGYMFANMNFKIPNDDEQKTIGRLFDNLDNLITLHQRKHDKLNKIKQSLLNDMFV